MTPNEFWYSEPRLLQSYIKKRELELDNINYNAWLIGLYVYQGFGVIINNAFSDKSSKKSTYFEKPLDLFNEKSQKEEIKDKKDMNVKYQEQYNYWAKIGKKGV